MNEQETKIKEEKLNTEEVQKGQESEESEAVDQGSETTEQSDKVCNKIKKLAFLKKSAKTYNALRIIMLCIAAGALIYASYNLTISYLNYKEDENKYAEIDNMFVQDVQVEQVGEDGAISYSTEQQWVWDYKAMLQYNEEAKGYIKLDGTRIQYPIVEHSDNSFYLWRGVDKVKNGSGSIFIDYRTAGLDGRMCVIYGHNMLNGSMFKDIMNFRNADFCKKHQTFDIYVGYRHYIYYVFSTFSAKSIDENVYQYGFKDDIDFQNWINKVSSKSSYQFRNRIPNTSDKIIMCSTCIDDYGNRQLVCMYRGEEVVD